MVLVVVDNHISSYREDRAIDFDSDDGREMENHLEILQRPHVQRELRVHGGRAQLLSSGDKKKIDGLFASAVYASGSPL